MGLDVTAYTKATALPAHEYDYESCYEAGHDRPFINPDFIAHAAGIEQICYSTDAKTFGFRAGSYSGYNAWRSDLARFAGYEKEGDAVNGGPFSELIYFSDCEGVIGPAVSAKLAKDFEHNVLRYTESRSTRSDDGWWLQKYADWMKAFRMAAEGGYVAFH